MASWLSHPPLLTSPQPEQNNLEHRKPGRRAWLFTVPWVFLAGALFFLASRGPLEKQPKVAVLGASRETHLWLRRNIRKIMPNKKPVPKVNMTEDIEEIGEHIFDVVVSNVILPPVPPPLLADMPALAAHTHATGPSINIASLPAPPLTNARQPLKIAQYRTTLNSIEKPLAKYAYLMELRRLDPPAFIALLRGDLPGTLPYVYTPTVGDGCLNFDTLFQGAPPQGLYIRSSDKGHVREVLERWPDEVDIVVMTDGSRILGLGDLGTNGMGISVGKLALYSAIAGFPTDRTLPVALDTGTDNVALRERESYPGQRQPRIQDGDYFPFVDEVVLELRRRWPRAVIQFEDFSSPHSFELLERYRHEARVFNDDIQGTGAVIAAGFVNAAKVAGVPLGSQRILIYGAGAAGHGVADTIKALMIQSGLTDEQAKSCFYLVDSQGLITTDRLSSLPAFKRTYARSDMPALTTLDSVVAAVRPTALIGLSGVPGAFTKPVVTQMARFSERPIIFALSNPTSKSEISGANAIKWTGGKAVFAAGSPYDPVTYAGRTYRIAQGNNLYVFPGLGLGAFLSQASEVSDRMVVAAAQALAESVSEGELRQGFIYPSLQDVPRITARVAARVMSQAKEDNLALLNPWPSNILGYVTQYYSTGSAPGV